MPFLGDEKNWFVSYISACHKFSNLPSSSKIPGTKLLFHSSIRFKNERNCFNVVSLGRASFGIVVSISTFKILKFDDNLTCRCFTHTWITWWMHLYTKPPDNSEKYAVSYISACTWMWGNRVCSYVPIYSKCLFQKLCSKCCAFNPF